MMIHSMLRKFVIAVFVAAQFSVGESAATAAPARSQDTRAYEIAVQTYLYAYPLVMMEITRRVSTNVAKPGGVLAPMGQFAHLREFPDHTFREIVRPNADTLYSIAWLDVAKEPIIVSVPDTGGRYYVLQMMSMWSDVFAAPGSRTSGNKAGHFAVVGAGWRGILPKGVQRLGSPTGIVWIVGRTQTNGRADYAKVHKIQAVYKLTPLSRWGKRQAKPSMGPINKSWDMKTPPPAQVAKMDAKTYFELFAALLKKNPPQELDWPMVRQLREIGIVPGRELDFAKLDPAVRGALQRAMGEGPKLIGQKIRQAGTTVNGWQFLLDGIGTYGTAYLQRAAIALAGIGANVPEDAIYPTSLTAIDGKPYNGRNRYVLRFEKGRLPPANAFWSLTIYDKALYFTDNPIKRYAIGDRDKLKKNADGSLDIYIQHKSPGKGKESNWLPAPAGEFNLVMRMYWPRIEALTLRWSAPAVRLVR